MSQRASDLFKDMEDRWEFRDDVSELGKKIKVGEERTNPIEVRILRRRLGICFECNNCDWCITEFDNVIAYCDHFEVRLSGRDKMKRCSAFKTRGQMSLSQMANMAWLIDIPKDGAGFVR